MVRGQTACPQFCQTCKQDCKCTSCGNCHWCYCKSQFGGGYNHNHSCSVPGTALASVDELDSSLLVGFSKLFKSDIYSVTVGSDANKASFLVHKEALAKTSRYFNALFNFDSEVERKEVVLDSVVDKPSAFESFVQFAYLGDYKCSGVHKDQRILAHAEVYVLAERFEALDLKDLAVRKATALCISLSAEVTGSTSTSGKMGGMERAVRTVPDIIRIIYENTPSSSNPAPESTSTTSEKGKEAASSGKKSKDSAPTTAESLLPAPSQDRFRVLISRFSATCLSMLKGSTNFMECVTDLPEFAQDLVKNVVHAGPMEVDAYGELKTA